MYGNIMGDRFISWEEIEENLADPHYRKKWMNDGLYEVNDVVLANVTYYKKIFFKKRKFNKVEPVLITRIEDLFTTNYSVVDYKDRKYTIEKVDIIKKL